jgi:hypothetical protein
MVFTGCPFLVATWHTYCCCDGTLAAVVFHPMNIGVYQNWVCFQIICGSFCGQCAHSLSSQEPGLPLASFLNSKAMLSERLIKWNSTCVLEQLVGENKSNDFLSTL